VPWTSDGSYQNSDTGRISAFHITITPASSITITYTKPGTYPTILVILVSGACGSLDTQNGATGGSNSISAGSVTPGGSGHLFIAGLMSANGYAATLSSSPNFTLGTSIAAGGNAMGGSSAYYVDTGTTTENPAFAVSGTTHQLSAGVWVYK
jgi:hypothetical protein